MTKKEKFIQEVEALDINLSEEALEYFNSLKEGKTSGGITEKGQQILDFMQENKDKFDNQFKAADIGEGLGVSGRSVSGSMKKLITDGYVIKLTPSPNVTYGLTD